MIPKYFISFVCQSYVPVFFKAQMRSNAFGFSSLNIANLTILAA